ncbi:MAG TPA: PsiF family protein [Usitatibacteraceae bacterium]
MNKLIAALMLALPLAATTAFAADEAKPAQQNKMTSCNKDAGDKKGDERKAFMKECLKKDGDKKTAQQEKMKACNKDASDKKGDERKAFMKDCLSK